MNEFQLQKKVNKRADSNHYISPSLVVRIIEFEITGADPQRVGTYEFTRPWLPIGVLTFSAVENLWDSVTGTSSPGIQMLTEYDKRIFGFNMVSEIEQSPTLIWFYSLLSQSAEPDSLTTFQNIMRHIESMPDECFLAPRVCTLDNAMCGEYIENFYRIVVVEHR